MRRLLSAMILATLVGCGHDRGDPAPFSGNGTSTDNVLTRNQGLSDRLFAALTPLAERPEVRHLRRRGMIQAFDVASDDPHFSRRFYRAALAREALLRPIGTTVYVMPPYIVSDAEIEHLARALEGALDEALAG